MKFVKLLKCLSLTVTAIEYSKDYRDDLFELVRSLRPRRVVEIRGPGSAGNSLCVDLSMERDSVNTRFWTFPKASWTKHLSGYTKLVCDICGDRVPTGFDLAISHYLAEHVPNGKKFHQNVFQMLNPGGLAFHCYPTMFCLALPLPTMIIPEAIGQKLVTWTDNARDTRAANKKIPAKYKWCFGPTKV